MYGSFYKRGAFAWVQDVRGDYLCVHKGDLAATIFSTAWEPWRVIFHRLIPTHVAILAHERFDDLQAAMSRAEQILDGKSAQHYLEQASWHVGGGRGS